MSKKIQGLPHFFPGRFYAAACIQCDGKILLDFCEAFYNTFYPLDLDDIDEKYEYCSEDGHTHIFLSIPIADMPLMHLMLEGTFNGGFSEMEPPIEAKNVRLIQFLPKDKLPFNPLNGGLNLWKMQHYGSCHTYLKNYLFFHPFCLFLSIRCRLSLPRDCVKDAETIVADTQAYLLYHAEMSGKDSEQYGIAVILNALALVWIGGNIQIAKKKMERALSILQPLNSSFVGFVHYSLGTYEASLGNAEVAFGHLKETDRRRFPLIASKYFKASRFAWANWFASHAFTDQPNKQHILLWAGILWKLDKHQTARRLLSIDGAKEFKNTLNWATDAEPCNQRVCCNCDKDGDVASFLRCPNCKKDWYCSQTCIDAHAEQHRPLCSWCWNCDKKLRKGQRQWCSGCSAVFYCGPDCQTIHWKKEHKKDCLRAKGADAIIATTTTTTTTTTTMTAATATPTKKESISSIKKLMKDIFQAGAVNQAKQLADVLQDLDNNIITMEHVLPIVSKVKKYMLESDQWKQEPGNKPPAKTKIEGRK